MKRPTFVETHKIDQGFLVYYTRKLHKINVWAVARYDLKIQQTIIFHNDKPVKQGDKIAWNQVPLAIRKSILEDYKSFYPSYEQ